MSSPYLNNLLCSCFIILIILSDYSRKYNTDNFQRKLFLAVFALASIAILTDFIGQILTGVAGVQTTNTMYFVISVFLVAQNCTYYVAAIFLDYFAYNDSTRSKKILRIVIVFLILYTFSIIINLFFGFYFYISDDNYYVPGRFYGLRLILSYSSILVIIIDILTATKTIRRSQVFSITFFVLLPAAGSVIDIVFKSGSLTWPCLAAGLLYLYFFIVQIDSKLDSLTGLGNRYSFNEFINKLSRQNTKEDYSIVMIDMDRFKLINDTFGHLEGDNALRDMATIIKSCIRHSDFAARYGGDEFVLATKAEYDIQRLMDRIQKAIDTQNEKNIRPYQLYMSYGYDVFTTNSGKSIQAFISHIDKLMYRNKEERRVNFQKGEAHV